MFSFIVCNTNEVKSPLVDARFQVESGTWANGFELLMQRVRNQTI